MGSILLEIESPPFPRSAAVLAVPRMVGARSNGIQHARLDDEGRPDLTNLIVTCSFVNRFPLSIPRLLLAIGTGYCPLVAP